MTKEKIIELLSQLVEAGGGKAVDTIRDMDIRDITKLNEIGLVIIDRKRQMFRDNVWVDITYKGKEFISENVG